MSSAAARAMLAIALVLSGCALLFLLALFDWREQRELTTPA